MIQIYVNTYLTMLKVVAFAATIYLLSGCVTPPSDASGRTLTLADTGPAPENHRVTVADVLRYRLKDYDSARIEYPTQPRPVVMASTALNSGGAGWQMCPLVNSKNSFGAYMGFKLVYILWSAGTVVDFKADDMAPFWCGDKNDALLAAGPRLP